MYKACYPPKRYVFYPLYRYLRLRRRWDICISYMAVWVVSGLLHGIIIAGFGHPVAGAAWALVFFLLGGVGTMLVYLKKRTRDRTTQ